MVSSLVYATVHSLLSSFADLHQKHSSALDSTEKKSPHFSDGKNKLGPHNFHPLEKKPKVHRFPMTLVACLFYMFNMLKLQKVYSPSFNFSYVTQVGTANTAWGRKA